MFNSILVRNDSFKMYVYTHMYIYICVYICLCVYIYICVCMYVCICIYICMITGQPVMYRDPWGPLLGFMMGGEVFKRHPFGICLVFRAYMKFQLNHRTYYRCGVLLDS